MNHMLELSEKNSNAVIIKILQQQWQILLTQMKKLKILVKK